MTSDLKEIIEIEKASFPDRKPWSENYFKNIYRKYPQGFLVAKTEGKVAGYAIGRVKNGSSEIISLAVHPYWRRKQVGAFLLKRLIDYFKKEGVKKILLHVRTKNKEASSFYNNFNFEIVKVIKNYYKNGDDAYLVKGGI